MTVHAPERTGTRVELVDLVRTYGRTRALDGLSLTLAPGELVALLGPSGCGKTTALRILAGLDDADSGQVLVAGREMSSTPTNQRDMGMVFQAYSLFPHMSVRDNVSFGLRMRGQKSSVRRRRADEMLELVGLSPLASRYAHQLSGGQQQRVALARALAIEPAVLLLDEPLSALDAKVRTQLREEIRRVQLEVGTTTLFVTHDQEEALAIADRVGVMSAGRLEQLAAPEQLYAQPSSEFVAGFVGLTNRIPAQVGGGTAVVWGQSLPVLAGSVGSGSGDALIRPEGVSLEPAADGPATVALVSFLGPISRVTCDVEGSTLVVQTSSEQASSLSPGDRVRVRFAQTPVLVVAS